MGETGADPDKTNEPINKKKTIQGIDIQSSTVQKTGRLIHHVICFIL
jgi:hypothetical protein